MINRFFIATCRVVNLLVLHFIKQSLLRLSSGDDTSTCFGRRHPPPQSGLWKGGPLSPACSPSVKPHRVTTFQLLDVHKRFVPVEAHSNPAIEFTITEDEVVRFNEFTVTKSRFFRRRFITGRLLN